MSLPPSFWSSTVDFYFTRLTAIAGKKWPFCLTFESAFLPSYLKRGRSLQFATNWLSFEILRLVNPFKLEVHSETTWPTPKSRHLAQCASFLLLGFWLSMATEKASRLMLVERRPMMLLGASCSTIKEGQLNSWLSGAKCIKGGRQ